MKFPYYFSSINMEILLEMKFSDALLVKPVSRNTGNILLSLMIRVPCMTGLKQFRFYLIMRCPREAVTFHLIYRYTMRYVVLDFEFWCKSYTVAIYSDRYGHLYTRLFYHMRWRVSEWVSQREKEREDFERNERVVPNGNKWPVMRTITDKRTAQ